MQGLVRKVDELGRVVIPKEMRRVLNIKTGSSIEMFIEENRVVLKKFSEIENVKTLAESLSSVLFDTYHEDLLVSDDERVLICKGANKKEFLNRKILLENAEPFFEIYEKVTINQTTKYNFTYGFSIKSEGSLAGFIIFLCQNKMREEDKKNIILLVKFLEELLKF